MNQKYINRNKNLKQNHTKMNETYATFIQLHSLDLKYMVPWSQYENRTPSNLENKNEKKILKSGDKKFTDKIEIISIRE